MSNIAKLKNDAVDILLRGEFDADACRALVIDAARNQEGIFESEAFQQKYGSAVLAATASNREFLDALQAELDNRIRNGLALKESARFHLAKTQATGIIAARLLDKMESTKNRLSAYQALEKLATAGGPSDNSRQHVTFTIITSLNPEAKPFMVDTIVPALPAADEPMTLAPITIESSQESPPPMQDTEWEDQK